MPKWWPFGRNEPEIDAETAFIEAEATLRQQIKQQLEEGTPRQAILKQIETRSQALEQEPQNADVKAQLRAYDLLYSELRPQLLGNLSTGKAHEMAGRIDEAIVHYERAMQDQVETRFPYEHLRVIYRRQEKYEEGLRVCRAAQANPFLDPDDHKHFRLWADRFAAHLSAPKS